MLGKLNMSEVPKYLGVLVSADISKCDWGKDSSLEQTTEEYIWKIVKFRYKVDTLIAVYLAISSQSNTMMQNSIGSIYYIISRNHSFFLLFNKISLIIYCNLFYLQNSFRALSHENI